MVKESTNFCNLFFSLVEQSADLEAEKKPNFSYSLEKYMDPNRPFKCEVCKESFTQKNILLVHYNSVSHLHRLKKSLQGEQGNNGQPLAAASSVSASTTTSTSTITPEKSLSVQMQLTLRLVAKKSCRKMHSATAVLHYGYEGYKNSK